MSAVLVFIDDESQVCFVWHGGAYVDVGFCREGGYVPESFTALDVINVWDDESGTSVYERRIASDPKPFQRDFLRIAEMFESDCRAFSAELMSEDAQ